MLLHSLLTTDRYVGAVYAGNDLFRSGMGAGFPLFATAMFKTLGIDWGSSLLGFLSVAFIPIPFALWYYGRRIREFANPYFFVSFREMLMHVQDWLPSLRVMISKDFTMRRCKATHFGISQCK